jgi:formylglycine-generating enzyme required for sulfatase activity
MTRTFALAALLTLAGCASAPMVAVLHTVPPKFNIVPAKTVAVIGRATTVEDREHEDEFVDLLIARLREYELYDVKDERALYRDKDWQPYLDATAGDVIVRVTVPGEDCGVYERTRGGDGDDADEVVGWDAECREYLDLFAPRTGNLFGSVDAHGSGSATDQTAAMADAMTDAADQIIGGFAPRQIAEAVMLDPDAPLVREGMAKFDHRDYDGALALWENALATAPDSAPLLYNLGALCEALHDSQAARAYYSRALAIAPNVLRYQQALVQLNVRRDDAAEAAIDPAVDDARKSVAATERAARMATTAVSMSGIAYLPIPAGTFTMGCTKGDIDCKEDEQPAHAVTIGSSFYIARTPVTNEQYQRCIDAGVCHGNPDPTKPLNPVVNVTWNDARDFCAWAGGRLPAEAEWEYAARGGVEGWRFPWGNSAGKGNANLADNGGRRVEALGLEQTNAMVNYPFVGRSPVGTFSPNGFALSDMTGNVSQWTADWKSNYASGAVTDPTGPPAGTERVVRGGSWADTGMGARLSIRYSAEPGYSQNTVGFRCAIDSIVSGDSR